HPAGCGNEVRHDRRIVAGRVTAIELKQELAARAKANLAAYPIVSVVQGDGSSVEFDSADVIYVNAGATQTANIWLDRLNN
ncbi:methyltransferase domain-containing protein, partial [Rhizobium ruizarguesonis]